MRRIGLAVVLAEARKGDTTRQIAELNVDRRRTMEAEITTPAVEFIKRNAKAGKPFYERFKRRTR